MGSAMCLRFSSNLDTEVIKNDVTFLPVSERPAWLTGTPTLCSTDGMNVYRGRMAIEHLYDVSVTFAATQVKGVPLSDGAPVTKKKPLQREPSGPDPKKEPPVPHNFQPHNLTDTNETSANDVWSIGPIPEEDEVEDEMTRKLTPDDLARAISSHSR